MRFPRGSLEANFDTDSIVPGLLTTLNKCLSIIPRLLCWKTSLPNSDRDLFSGLDGDARRDILKEPLVEIVRMLEQNLLNKFREEFNAEALKKPKPLVS